jgi:hypothetical protein
MIILLVYQIKKGHLADIMRKISWEQFSVKRKEGCHFEDLCAAEIIKLKLVLRNTA